MSPGALRPVHAAPFTAASVLELSSLSPKPHTQPLLRLHCLPRGLSAARSVQDDPVLRRIADMLSKLSMDGMPPGAGLCLRHGAVAAGQCPFAWHRQWCSTPHLWPGQAQNSC